MWDGGSDLTRVVCDPWRRVVCVGFPAQAESGGCGLARRQVWAGLLGVGAALAAWEVVAVARVVRREDPGGRSDHDATLGTGLGEPLQVVFLGDSAVDGYGLHAEQALPRQVAARLANVTGRRVRVRSVAASGATSADVAASQLPLLRAAGEVDAVVVGVGVNDALRRVRGDAITEATQAIVHGVRDIAADAAFAYVPCHDLARAPGLGPVLRRLLGWRCRAVAHRQRAVLEELDVPVAMADRRGTAGMFGDDGLHPGARGVEIISSLVVGALSATSPTATT